MDTNAKSFSKEVRVNLLRGAVRCDLRVLRITYTMMGLIAINIAPGVEDILVA